MLIVFFLFFFILSVSGQEERCSDGTLVGSCSINPPTFCKIDNEVNQQILANDCEQCGCPGGAFCIERSCIGTDGQVVTPEFSEEEINLYLLKKGEGKIEEPRFEPKEGKDDFERLQKQEEDLSRQQKD